MSRKTGSAYGPSSHSHSWRYGCYERGSGLWLTTQTRDALQRRTPSGQGTTCTNGSQLECLKISDGAKGNGRSTRDTLPLRAGDDACARYLCDLSFAAVCVLSALVEQAPFGVPFCLRSACRAENTHALQTHALPSPIRYAPKVRPVVEGVGCDGTPFGQRMLRCPIASDKSG